MLKCIPSDQIGRCAELSQCPFFSKAHVRIRQKKELPMENMALKLAPVPDDLRQVPEVLVRRLCAGLSHLDPRRPLGPEGQRILSRDPINSDLRAPGHSLFEVGHRTLSRQTPQMPLSV